MSLPEIIPNSFDDLVSKFMVKYLFIELKQYGFSVLFPLVRSTILNILEDKEETKSNVHNQSVKLEDITENDLVNCFLKMKL